MARDYREGHIGVPPPAIDPDIDALNLEPSARWGAEILRGLHPDIKFTSGRRGREDQARAMAQNVVKNRKWIEQTYRHTTIRDALQSWIDITPEAVTQKDITTGFLAVMDPYSDGELAALSKHFLGLAFDVRPVEENAEQIKADIRALPKLAKFLEKEGGLIRWHTEFYA